MYSIQSTYRLVPHLLAINMATEVATVAEPAIVKQPELAHTPMRGAALNKIPQKFRLGLKWADHLRYPPPPSLPF